MAAATLKVGGYTPFTATDYPGQLSAVVFVAGCAWRCGYCHNPHLQQRPRRSPLPWPALLQMLRRRAGMLDAVVFSGGEPTTDAALPDAMRAVRDMGYRVGLHTACIYPDRLKKVLPLADWVGFDIKAPFAEYQRITGASDSGRQAELCARAIIDSGIDYECRTTVHPTILAPDGIIALAHTLAGMGVSRYALQQFRSQGCDSGSLRAAAGAGYPPQDVLAQVAPLFERFTLR
jgi:anaerobic ribonucleoside-triphosphate reductase activating protein